MSCTKPLHGYVSSHNHPSGKTKFTFDVAKSIDGKVMYIPCGSCDSCCMKQAAVKGFQSELEASMNGDYGDHNTYLTVTFDNEHLAPDLGLHHEDWQEFAQALRDKERSDAKKENRKPATIKFSMCGEYGKASARNNWIARPHFHAIIFNYKFDDVEPESTNDFGQILYSSESCATLWGRGNIKIGEVSSASANYVARHNDKKLTNGKNRILVDAEGKRYMMIWNSNTGKRNRVRPEYSQSSNRPGIGKKWYDKFKSDIYEVAPRGLISCGHYADFPQIKASQHYRLPPPYFDTLFERENPAAMAEIKAARVVEAQTHAADNTHERLETKAKIAKINRDRKAKEQL